MSATGPTNLTPNRPKPVKHGDKLQLPSTSTLKRQSLTNVLNYYFRELENVLNTNNVRVIDSMTYASDALAQAAWVASDAVAATGVNVTRNTVQKVYGTSSVKFTTGTGSFSSDVTVTNTLSGDPSNYDEDSDGHKKSVTYQNWDSWNYLCFIYYAGAATAAGDIDVIVTDKNDNTATYDLPAITGNYAANYQAIAIAFSDFTYTSFDWTQVKSLAFKFTSDMGTSEAVTIDQIVLAKFANNYGPSFGRLNRYMAANTSVARGVIAKFDTTYGLLGGMTYSADGDEELLGMVVSDTETAGDYGYVQETGMFLGRPGENVTSWEVGDALGVASLNTFANSASTNADACFRYVSPIAGSASKNSLVWIQCGFTGATPS